MFRMQRVPTALKSVVLCAAIGSMAAIILVAGCADEDTNGPVLDNRIFVDQSNASGIEDGTRAHPYNTIQEAIDAAQPSGHVFVLAGRYVEAITINKRGLTLEGESEHTAVIDGNGQEAAITVQANAVTVKNLEIRDAASWGIHLVGADSCWIVDNRVHGISGSGIELAQGSRSHVESNEVFDITGGDGESGIAVMSASHCEVRKNWVHHATVTVGVWADSSDGTVLEANNINHLSSYSYCHGLQVDNSDSVKVLENVIGDVHASSHYSRGILAQSCLQLLLARNTISDISGPWENYGILSYLNEDLVGSGMIIEDNEIEYVAPPGGQAIAVWHADVLVQRNKIDECGQGIQISFTTVPSAGAAIRANHIRNASLGIGLDGSRNLLEDNTLQDDGVGIQINEGRGENQIFHNNFVESPIPNCGAVTNMWYSTTLLEGNFWSDYPGLDNGSGTAKHSIAGDGIGDTQIPWPAAGCDLYPFMRMDGWEE